MSEFVCAKNPASPNAPAIGTLALYAKLDGLWYSQDSTGLETLLTGSASIDGGSAGSVYMDSQIIDGGGA